MTNRFILARQAIDLKSGHETNVIERDFGNEPGKIMAANCRSAGLAEIAVKYANPIIRPAPLLDAFAKSALRRNAFGMLDLLLRVRLADIDDGQPVQMPRLNLGGARDFNHRSPPCPVGRAP